MGIVQPPFSRVVAARLGVGLPTIESFNPAIRGDGVTDDSTAIKAAHDAAFAAGVREVHCARQYNAPNAYNLGNVHFRGPGALIGTYRKRVIPYSARSISPMPSKILPAVHLRRFAKALNPIVVIWGDSTGTYGANNISVAQLLWPMLERAILRDNPGRTITMVNRSIGGTSIGNFNNTGSVLQAASISLPTFFSNPAAPWSGYVSNQNPDLVVLNWGTNNPTVTLIHNIQAVVGFLQGLPKVPDIIICTNLPKGTQGTVGSGMVQALDDRDYAAGALRSFAEYGGYGLIDLHRIGCILRDGFDPCAQIMSQNLANTVFPLPAQLPLTEGDFDLTFTIDNTGGAAFGASQQIDIFLSSNGSNVVRLYQQSGFYTFIGYSGGGGDVWKVATTSPVSMPTGLCTVRVAVKNSMLSLYVENTLIYEGLCHRHGGRFQPTVQYATGSGVSQINVLSYVNSTPSLTVPALTDAEMFGAVNGPQGGNGDNHPGAAAYEAIHTLAFDSANFSMALAGRPVQAISGAAAINPEAGAVQLTGPASGTYAVTLAAPRVQDQGVVLPIEMVATTGSNTVTLALTNVAGGSALATCTWNAAGQKLVLVGCASKWEVIKQDGVVLT